MEGEYPLCESSKIRILFLAFAIVKKISVKHIDVIQQRTPIVEHNEFKISYTRYLHDFITIFKSFIHSGSLEMISKLIINEMMVTIHLLEMK